MKAAVRKRPALVIHGGAGKKPATPREAQRAREALQKIAAEAYARLCKDGAFEAVAWAVTALEDDPQFNAGTGGKLQSDGAARLSASIMDGTVPRFSGVINLEQVKNPVLVAKLLQKEKDRVLAAEGAQRYARLGGFGVFNPVTVETLGEWKKKTERLPVAREKLYGTVGAVAVDREGRLAAATSTGGKGMEIPGRVSDSATVAGNFASKKAAVSATGIGEEIIDLGLAVRIVTRTDDGLPLAKAFDKTFREFAARRFSGGAIGVDIHGNVAVRKTTPCILHAVHTSEKTSVYP